MIKHFVRKRENECINSSIYIYILNLKMIDRIYSINNLVRIKSKSDTFMLCLKKSFPFSFFFFSLQNPLRHPVCIVCTCAHRMQAKAPRIELSKRVP